MFCNKELFLERIGNQTDLIPQIYNILAKDHISDKSYAAIFQLIFFDNAAKKEDVIAYCKATGDWRRGSRPISDIKLICVLDKVCEIIRYYVLASWDECIFSAWCSDEEVTKALHEMDDMETMEHMKNISQIASESMVYSSDGTFTWSENSK